MGEDGADEQLVGILPQLLASNRFDYTRFFIGLSSLDLDEVDPRDLTLENLGAHFASAQYTFANNSEGGELLQYFVRLYRERLSRTGVRDHARRAVMQS